MPLEEDLDKQRAFPFGVGVQTPCRPGADSLSGAEKPARDKEEPGAQASEDIPRTLADVLLMMTGEALPADARQLLADIPVLQEWQRARNPGHKIRDAMLKLGMRWGVPGKVKGKKRPPAEVAQEIEENMLKKAKKILIGSVAKPAYRDSVA